MKASNTLPIAVLGAGSWGTALAHHLAENGTEVFLWGKNTAEIKEIQENKSSNKYLPGIPLSNRLHATTELEEALLKSRDILIVVPSHAFREVIELVKTIRLPSRIAWATKGLDSQQHQLLDSVVIEILGNVPMAVLSGPNFAKEVARGLPTAITLASNDKNFSQELTNLFHSKNFRVYSSSDIIGVEIGGSMKNVLAIAVGISDGLELGANARSALITRGLAEMIRLGLALGAKQETFIGLSGVGDLVLTCTDNQSRNRRFGMALGKGHTTEYAAKEIGQVVEGIKTTAEIFHLAKLKNIELPICEQVYNVLYKNLAPKQAAENLLSRSVKDEFKAL